MEAVRSSEASVTFNQSTTEKKEFYVVTDVKISNPTNI
jgi:hypothetical protein